MSSQPQATIIPPLSASAICSYGGCSETTRPERKTCVRHGKIAAAATHKQVVKRREKGLCSTFGCPILPSGSHTLCDEHLARMRATAHERWIRQTSKSLCINSCGRKVEFPPMRYCLMCETSRRERKNCKVSLPFTVRKLIHQGFVKYRRIESQRFLLKWLYLLKPKEQAVLRIVYDLGFLGGERRTLTYAGQQMGFNRERARQLHDNALIRIFAVPDEVPTLLIPIKARMEKYPQRLNERLKARRRVTQALKQGKLERKPCTHCGAKKAHAHHHDYSKPLDVQWLCQKCHSKEHRRLKQENAA